MSEFRSSDLTVQELIEKLSKFNKDEKVFIYSSELVPGSADCEGEYLNEVEQHRIFEVHDGWEGIAIEIIRNEDEFEGSK